MTQEMKLVSRILPALAILAVLWGGAMTVLWLKSEPSPRLSRGWSVENQRALANKLRSVGLTKEAIAQYEEYMSVTDAPPASVATTAYLIGTLCMEAKTMKKR